MSRQIPIQGCTLSAVEGEGRFCLKFDDPTSASLDVDGEFEIRASGNTETYKPPCPDWVRDVLSSFIGVEVLDGRYDRRSNLTIRFVDERELYIPDGPYENWHFYKDKLHFVGGVGRVVIIE